MAIQDLSDDYANGKYIDGAEGFPPKWAAAAEVFRAAMTDAGRCSLDVPYGPTPRESFDLFLPEKRPLGLVIFVHGGYWMAFDKSSWSHFAQGALARGYAVAVPQYSLCPEVRVSDITRQIKAAVEMAATQVDGPIYLTGHSAGGHLVSRMQCDDVGLEVIERVEKVVSISGVHDLRPLLQTNLNDDLNLDADEAARESPIMQQRGNAHPVVAWVGGNERPAFIDQSRWLGEAWQNTTLHIDEGKHHFDVIDGLLDPSSPLMDCLLGEN